MDEATLARLSDHARDLILKARRGAIPAQNALNAIWQALVQCDPDVLNLAPPAAGRYDQHPPMLGWIAEPVLPPSQILTFTNVQRIAANSDSTEYDLDFENGDGFILGFNGSVVDRDDTFITSIAMQLRLQDDDYITTTGDRATFEPWGDLFVPGQVYSPLLKPVTERDTLFVKFRNLHPTEALEPSLTCMFLRWQDILASLDLFRSCSP